MQLTWKFECRWISLAQDVHLPRSTSHVWYGALLVRGDDPMETFCGVGSFTNCFALQVLHASSRSMHHAVSRRLPWVVSTSTWVPLVGKFPSTLRVSRASRFWRGFPSCFQEACGTSSWWGGVYDRAYLFKTYSILSFAWTCSCDGLQLAAPMMPVLS